MYKQVVAESIAGRKQGTESKNPAKSLNATINLEQMLSGAKHGRVLPQAQRNSMIVNNGNNNSGGSN